ncbi:MAG: hypothetical protein ACJ8CB_19440 [Ktedonobacteraceae bacterium]
MSKPRTTHIYTVMLTSYASQDIKMRVERGEEFIRDQAQLTSDVLSMGTSEARASAAFYRGVKKAMDNPLAIHITV